ncbi:MAG: S41 family peptidase [Anaerolineaceae bacterium]|nr:S41 family peptidase [Anaerolineaceae bacterium]
MFLRRLFCFLLAFCILILSSCQTAIPVSPASSAETQPTTAANAVRTCDFIPGKSVPAQISPDSTQTAVNPLSLQMTFSNTAVDIATTARQLDLYQRVDADIINHYVYGDYNGSDWKAISLKYKQLIQKGLNQADFYLAIKQMVNALDGGKQSYFLNPDDQAKLNAATPSSEFAGIGGFSSPINDQGKTINVFNWVYPASPADKAGIKAHDVLLNVDGGPVMAPDGSQRIFGQAGSAVVVTIQPPGKSPVDIKLVRNKISQTSFVDDCLVPGTHIGYIRWMDLNDPTVLNQTVDALNQMSGSSLLQGLIIDKRLSAGSDNAILLSLLSMFMGGELGSFVAVRSVNNPTPIPFIANPVIDASGSLNEPLIVIQDQTTGDAALFGGVLQLAKRARIVGQPASGGAFTHYVDDFSDGSTLVLADMTFQPNGRTPGYWDKTGVAPDVTVYGRWDQFSEANDPYIAKAIDLLTEK